MTPVGLLYFAVALYLRRIIEARTPMLITQAAAVDNNTGL